MTKTISSRIEELDKVWTPEARWTIPQAPRKTDFLFPAFGPNAYNNVVKQVLANRERGANLPRGEQLAFLLDEAYNCDDDAIKKSPRREFVMKIMRDGWLWIPVVNITTPKDIKNPGMYSVFDENGQGLARVYSLEELEDRLFGGDTERGVKFSQDRTIAFAPQNTIKAGEHNTGALAQDGAYIAVYRPKGAEALDRVAEQFRFKPYSCVVDNNSDEPIQALSALYRGRDLAGGLVADFHSGGYDRGGYVISVSGSENSAEGTALKN